MQLVGASVGAAAAPVLRIIALIDVVACARLVSGVATDGSDSTFHD